MNHSKRGVGLRHGMYLAAALGLAAASFDHLTHTGGVQAQAVRGTPPLAPGTPEPVDDLQRAVEQTAAVIEGLVFDIQYDYSDEAGPWTRVFLSNVRVLVGDAPSTVEIRHFGGPLPSGRFMVALSVARASAGDERRYAQFLDPPSRDGLFDSIEEALESGIAFGRAIVDGDIPGEGVEHRGSGPN